MSFLIGVIVVLVGLAGISFIMWRVTEKQRVELEKEFDVALTDNKELLNHLSTLKEELRIKNENRKKADEKIENLHNGDTVSNAINSLSKH